MTEHSGIARALEVLGDKIVETEEFLLDVENQLSNANRELESLREENKELTDRLKQAEADRDTACGYALQLEELLKECREIYAKLQEGGGERCKKSQ